MHNQKKCFCQPIEKTQQGHIKYDTSRRGWGGQGEIKDHSEPRMNGNVVALLDGIMYASKGV